MELFVPVILHMSPLLLSWEESMYFSYHLNSHASKPRGTILKELNLKKSTQRLIWWDSKPQAWVQCHNKGEFVITNKAKGAMYAFYM
jgi:hypothetical protein